MVEFNETKYGKQLDIKSLKNEEEITISLKNAETFMREGESKTLKDKNEQPLKWKLKKFEISYNGEDGTMTIFNGLRTPELSLLYDELEKYKGADVKIKKVLVEFKGAYYPKYQVTGIGATTPQSVTPAVTLNDEEKTKVQQCKDYRTQNGNQVLQLDDIKDHFPGKSEQDLNEILKLINV